MGRKQRETEQIRAQIAESKASAERADSVRDTVASRWGWVESSVNTVVDRARRNGLGEEFELSFTPRYRKD